MLIGLAMVGSGNTLGTSDRPEFEAALIEVRDAMVRQITDAGNRTEPSNNRARRETL